MTRHNHQDQTKPQVRLPRKGNQGRLGFRLDSKAIQEWNSLRAFYSNALNREVSASLIMGIAISDLNDLIRRRAREQGDAGLLHESQRLLMRSAR